MKPRAMLARIGSRLRGTAGKDADGTSDILMLASEEAEPRRTRADAPKPAKPRWYAHPGVISVAASLGIGLDGDDPDLPESNWDQTIDGIRWTIVTRRDDVRSQWMTYEVSCREEGQPIMDFRTWDGRFVLSISAVAETVALALVGCRLDQVVEATGPGAALIVKSVETNEARTVLDFGYQPYKPI